MVKSIKKEAKPSKIKTSRAKEKEPDVYPDEEQGILPKETSEDTEEEMLERKKDPDVYSKEGRDVLEEEGDIEPWEEGFMEGASDLGQLGKDALTGKPIMGADEVVELEFEGKLYRFVSQKNATDWLAKQKKAKKK